MDLYSSLAFLWRRCAPREAVAGGPSMRTGIALYLLIGGGAVGGA